MKKGCELCSSQAKMYCESDQASLCWDCDEKVHGANFLVAKHMRTVLCHVCQSQTPWKATGLKLGRTVSICDGCVSSGSSVGGCRGVRKVEEKREFGEEAAQRRAVSDVERSEHDDLDVDDDDDGDDEDGDDFDDDSCSEYDGYDDCDDDEDDENQVVPWTSTPLLNTAATASTSSSGEEESYFCAGSGDGDRAGSANLKQMREIAFLHSHDGKDYNSKVSTASIGQEESGCR
ncbi:hypothetical protein Ancab_004380 [Ancistrocladus abbreviatus]